MWNGLFDFSIFLIHMSSESSFYSIKSSKLSDVLKILVMEPIKNEKKVRPKNSSKIENMYSLYVLPE